MRKPMAGQVEVKQKNLFGVMNELFKLKKRVSRSPDGDSLNEYVDRVVEKFEDMGLYFENPTGETWDETRTDCEASIAGDSVEDLIITEVMKPIIRLRNEGFTRVVQKGVVIVESKEEKEHENHGSDN